MVKSNQDLEMYLDRLGLKYQSLPDSTLLVGVSPGQPPVALRFEPPVVVLEVKIGEIPVKGVAGEARLFRRLLELNASDLLHAAYGLTGPTIVLSAALEADNLDLNELEATLADMGMALVKHTPALREMVS